MLPPHNTHQARYNATSLTTTRTHDPVWTRPPREDGGAACPRRDHAVETPAQKGATMVRERRGFPPKDTKDKEGFAGKRIQRKVRQQVRQAQLWERPLVTLTSRRRVRSPDWRRERRHAQKGRGAEKEAGQGGGASLDKKEVCGR